MASDRICASSRSHTDFRAGDSVQPVFSMHQQRTAGIDTARNTGQPITALHSLAIQEITPVKCRAQL